MKSSNLCSVRTYLSPRLFAAFTTLLFALTLMAATASAQVSVTATAGTVGPTPYTTVKLAFDAINAGTHQGAITIDIQANTTEGTTPATLNSSGAGSAVYTSVLIRPTADGVSISGNPATGFGVIQLKGADNVTIDGDNPNTGGINRNLTVNNTNTTTAIANSAIRIATAASVVTSADNDTIKNCILNGNVTAGNAAAITSATSSSNSSFGIYVGGNGGATATDAPTAITSVTANTAPSGTTVNNLLIDNNAVNQCARAIVFNGAATSVSTGVTITNNVVGDQGTPTPATPPYTTPATTVYTKGIWVGGTSSINVTGNTLKNIMSYVITTITTVELVSPIGTTVTISNNTITNPTNNNTAGSPVKAILVSNATGTYNISGNIITNVQSLAAASGTAAIDASGAVTSGTIELNKVSVIRNLSASTFGCWGISIGAGNSVTLKNNFVSDLSMNMTGGAAFSTTFGVHGIRIASGTGHKIYHNSVNMFGALSGTAATSILTSAFTIVATTQTGMDVRNNIFSNTMTGGTTSVAHVSMFLPSSATAGQNLLINNNDYFSGNTAGQSGIAHVGATYTAVPAGPPTFAGLYTAANFDASMTTPNTNLRAYTSTLGNATNDNASKVVDPQFLSSSDLHIAVASPMVDAGDPAVGVTTDIDGQLRVGNPDIGADEPSGVAPPANDIAATAIVTPAPNGSVLNGSIVSPQASFKNVGTATQNGVMVQFTITGPGGYNYSNSQTIATITPNQTITVTFAAAPAFTTTGTYTSTATVLTPDANAANDSVNATFSVFDAITGGSVNVGTGQTYTSLTNPAGIFDAINSGVVTSNITVNVTSDLTAETGTISLNQFAGGFTMFVQPSGGARLISGSSAAALINLNGADGVTFSGLAFGGKSLTIRNTNNAGLATVRLTNDASNNAILSCIVEGGIANASGGVIFIAAGTTTGNDNNAITDSIIRDRTDAAGVPANLVVSLNASTTATNSNIIVSNNQVKNFTSNGIATSAIVSADNWTITNNNIFQEAARTTTIFGINLGGSSGTNLISGNSIHGFNTGGASTSLGMLIGNASNLTISRNRIYDFQTTAAATGVIEGIEYDGASGATPSITVVNNMVVLAPTLATAQPIIGIQDFGFGGNVFTADNNSIYIGGTASGGASSWALRRGTLAPTTYTARNNVAFNNRSGGTGNHFAGGDQSANTGTFVSNSNFYAGTGATPANFMDYGTASGGTPVSFAAWQAGPPARDAGSTAGTAATFVVTDIFVDAAATGDLHIKPTAGAGILGAGTPLGSVTVDFDNDPRPAAPDRGADELVQAVGGVIPAGTYYNAAAADGDSLGGDVTITNTLYLAGKLSTGANTLTIDCNGSILGASPTSFVIGNLKKNYCSTGVKGFEVGTANGYSPVSVTITAGTFPAAFTVKAVQGVHPNLNVYGKALQRYWTLTASGVTADITFNYVDPTDIPPTANENAFVIFKYNGTWTAPGGSVNAAANSASISGVTSFSDWTLAEPNAPTAAPAMISGVVTTTDGQPLGGVTVNLSGGHLGARTITDANGQYRFNNVETDGFYIVTPGLVNYSFSPTSRAFALMANKTDAVFTAHPNAHSDNPLNGGDFFVRQQYLDFLGREPEAQGWLYWTDQISLCGMDQNCVKQRRLDVSAAFFMSDEFQRSGNYVYRLYRAALGRQLTYTEFTDDHKKVVGGADLEALRTQFADEFVERSAFVEKYQNAGWAEGFVDALIQTVGQDAQVDLSSQREALITTYNSGGDMNHSRSAVLRAIAERSEFKTAVYNPSFVLMEYFGYLRRDMDQTGFDFWVNVLNNRDLGNYRGMVCSFTTSAEYQLRFSPVVTHSNTECGP